ncbi:MAG: phage portal protein, partial [Pyrinomonadaceae bacterium]
MEMITDQDIDALIGIPNPPKEQMGGMGGAYDAASRTSRELALWEPMRRSADGDILPDKGIADSRVRDMARNDAYVSGGVG